MVSAVLERRAQWHPRHDNKFIVGGGSQITLYEWAADFAEIRHVTSQHDLQFMRCFAWSPDPSFDDLVAVGHGTGQVSILRLTASKYSRDTSSFTTGPTVTLPVRNSRSCNTVAFCNADSNYLAVGLDKVRGESSLVIWDVHTALPILSLGTKVSSAGYVSPRPQPHIPRGDVGPRADMRILQQLAPTETVSSLAWLPKSTHLLMASMSSRWLRLFDLRSPVPSSINVAAKVSQIATDPFDSHRIASFGDGIVTMWDTRKLHPLITLSERDALGDGAVVRPTSVYSTIEFSSTRRGTLATLEKDASFVRMWDLMSAQAQRVEGSDGAKSIGSSVASSQMAPRLSWATLPWAASATAASGAPPHLSPLEIEHSPSLVISDTRHTKTFSRPLASFSLVPSSSPHPLKSQIMVVNKEGDLELYEMHDTPKSAKWSPLGGLAIGAGEVCKVISPTLEVQDLVREPWDPLLPIELVNGPDKARHVQPVENRLVPEHRGRGRERAATLPPASLPLFGRGDEDGFPALASPASATAKPIRQASQETRYSPATLRALGGSSNLQDRPFDRSLSTSRPVPKEQNAVLEPFPTSEISAKHVVADDISVSMKRRAVRGYGISDIQRNLSVLHMDLNETPDNDVRTLLAFWTWLKHSQEYTSFPTTRLHGYDFSYEGVLGIWEGLDPPTETTPDQDKLAPPQVDLYHDRRGRRSRSPADDLHGSFHAALQDLSTRRGNDRTTWKPGVITSKLLQRQVALQLCGWSFRDDDFSNKLKRWEKDRKFSRAACWLVFTRQVPKAIELLMRSEDESHHMMAGTLAALASYTPSANSSKTSELQKHAEHLIIKLQDPYFRALFAHQTLGDWSDVLEEETLPFRERLAIAFQFLDDRTLTSYLRRWKDQACLRGDIDGLMLTGLTKAGMDVLQRYLDRTGDVQTASILSSYVNPTKFRDKRGQRWVEAYRDLLDGFKLHHFRVAFDISYGQTLESAVHSGELPPFNWVPSQILIRCNYCNKPLSLPGSSMVHEGRPTSCPNCNRNLPSCSVCLMTLSIIQDSAREAELARTPYIDTIDEAVVICQSCRHGGHAAHILGWFFGEDGVQSHDACPVAGCECQCANLF